MNINRRTALAYTIRERPKCREFIVRHRYRPFLVDGKWDGHSVCKRDGSRVTLFFSGEMRKQMRKMIAEGYWDGES